MPNKPKKEKVSRRAHGLVVFGVSKKLTVFWPSETLSVWLM